MSPEQRGLLAIAGAVAVLVWLCSPFTPIGLGKGPAGGAGLVQWNPRRPRGHEGPCPSAEIGGCLDSHQMYRRPARCAHNRQLVMDKGWEWIASPPGEQDF